MIVCFMSNNFDVAKIHLRRTGQSLAQYVKSDAPIAVAPKRPLKTRIAEHKKAVSMFDHNSWVATHVYENSHQMDFSLGFHKRPKCKERSHHHPRCLQIRGTRISLALHFLKLYVTFAQALCEDIPNESKST